MTRVNHSDTIAAGYALEWSHVFAASEPLNWHSVYVAPEWRFGT